MKNNKNTITILAAAIIYCLFYIKLTSGSMNSFFSYGNDVLIVALLLAFSERIILLLVFTPFAIHQNYLVFRKSSKTKNKKTGIQTKLFIINGNNK